ncbi:MAG: hypothetical protein JWR21_905 [Herminiimonas sp.]|nr:hypothetical protein [Herminiimonas sp.]
MSRCLHCQKLDLRSSRSHAAVGLGHCPRDPSERFVPISLDEPCIDFDQASAETVAKREEWNNKRTKPAHIG